MTSSPIFCIFLLLLCLLFSSFSCLSTRSGVPVEIKGPSQNSGGSALHAGEEGYMAQIFIASLPPVADVYMDGEYVGKTNITKMNVKPGAHKMKFVKDGKAREAGMTFKEGPNRSKFVNIR
jgi:hypothetical protein